MTYIDRALASGENVLHRGQLHWVIYVRPVLFLTIGIGLTFVAISAFENNAPDGVMAFLTYGSLFFLFVGVPNLLLAWIKRVTTEIAVTSRRVIVKYGLIWRETMEMNAGKIESIQVDQTITGRILDFGTIAVRGTGSGIEPIYRVAAPLKLRAAINRLHMVAP
jgi:uncharacterized membrane protein YdbT with pleckstrin-like domain